MPYTLLVQQLREADVTEDALRSYLDGATHRELTDDTRQYLAGIEAEKGRSALEKALDRWNTDFPA